MKLGYTIIYVADVPETVAFYEKAFGINRRFVHESGQFAEMETGQTSLAFACEELVSGDHPFRRNRLEDLPAGAEIGFVTEDVQARYERAVAAGAKPAVPPTVKPWGQTVSYVLDNNGFLVEICSVVAG